MNHEDVEEKKKLFSVFKVFEVKYLKHCGILLKALGDSLSSDT